jgi:hypothetical protein
MAPDACTVCEKYNDHTSVLACFLVSGGQVFRVSSFGDKDPRAKDERHNAQRRGSGITGLLP